MRQRSSFAVAGALLFLVAIGSVVGCAATTRTRTDQAAQLQNPQPLPATTRSAPATSPSGLANLARAFRTTYDAERAAVDDSLSPLIVIRFSDVYLVRDRQVQETDRGIPRKYHLLHRTAHVPFVIFLRLRSCFGKPLDDDVAANLERYVLAIDEAEADLKNHGFSDDEIDCQRSIFEATRTFLGSLGDGQTVTEAEFAEYQAGVHASVMQLADLAGEAQVDALHEVMRKWRPKFADDEWRRVKVLIVGPRQPRHDYAATQYFAALFPDRQSTLYPGESGRVFYVESVHIDRDDTTFANERKLMATMILDSVASSAIFHNPYRMSIDVMADGARRRIGSLNFSGLR